MSASLRPARSLHISRRLLNRSAAETTATLLAAALSLMPLMWFWPMPAPMPMTATLMRSFAPMVRPVEGAWFWPYTGVLNRLVVATAAARVEVFLIKSRRVVPSFKSDLESFVSIKYCYLAAELVDDY